MTKLAVYGKGGIGKSTMSANISVALARANKRVLQIGCDPKHDSTRLLLGGRELTTVLDYMRVTGPLDYKLTDILATGYMGIGCVEAGGPKPGVGCAGRGIISTFELLEQFNLSQTYDTTLYDVLGDVVCGGFAVPIRREYADTILIVTSGEFMALYAANNILRGIQNFDGDMRRVAGLVFNRRAVEDEENRVRRFAEAVELPVFIDVPRSDAFTRAERAGVTVMQLDDDAQVCSIFDEAAAKINRGCELYQAKPLLDDELERVVLGSNSQHFSQSDVLQDRTLDAKTPNPDAASATQTNAETSSATAPAATASGKSSTNSSYSPDLAQANKYLSKNVRNSEPLHGCAFNGAVSTAVHLSDAVVLAHSPKSCTYISYQAISSTGRRRLFERGSLLPASLSPNLECTEMSQPEIVFGGMEKLEAKLQQILHSTPAPPAVIVVSSCPAGIIGDDIDAVGSLSTPQTKVIPISADGNMAGDYMQGMFMTYTTLARNLINKSVAPKPRTVNIISEKMVVTGTEQNFELISGFLERMGIKINCRFLYDCPTKNLENFLEAELLLPAYSDYSAKTLTDFFEKEYDCKTYERGFPIGYDETCDWLRELGEKFGAQKQAQSIIDEQKSAYEAEIARLKPQLEGRKLMVITYNSELDWILKTAIDCGMQVIKIGALDYSQDFGFRTRLGIEFPVELHYDPNKRATDIESLKPDVLLTNYASSVTQNVPVCDTIPMCPYVGFESGIMLAKRWALLLKMNLDGGWKNDESLFDKYYSR